MREQFESIDITKFRDLDITDSIEDWTERVMQQMPSITTLLNRDLLADNMMAVGNEGIMSAVRKAEQQSVSYTQDDTDEANRSLFDYVENRADALLGRTPVNAEIESDVRNPWLDSGIDIATAVAIAYLLRRTLRGNHNDERAWYLEYVSKATAAVSTRAAMLTWDSLGKSFANGVIGFVSRFLPVYKTWLETTSRVPRDEHLAIVGETVPFNEKFSHGQFWSQESVNCKCGVDVSFGRP